MKSEIITRINGIPIYGRVLRILPKNKSLQSRARALRKAGVLSEVIFWLQVKNNLFHHIDFDRQRIIGNFIVDFYIKSLGLIIEIDGSSHNNKEEYDMKREAYLTHLGLFMYRISDTRVKHDLNNVLKELEDFICEKFSQP
jgi:very-short-patch-repair endonuclease